jgi:hypothetical protein
MAFAPIIRLVTCSRIDKYLGRPYQINTILDNDLKVNFGETSRETILRRSDGINNMYLRVTLPKLEDNYRWVSYIGLALLKRAYLMTNGDIISDRNGEYHYMKNPLSKSYCKMIGHGLDWGSKETTLYIPLDFGFNNESFSSLHAMYCTLQIEIEIEELSKLIQIKGTTPTTDIPDIFLKDSKLMTDDQYIVESKDRRIVAQQSAENGINNVVIHKYDIKEGLFNTKIYLNRPFTKIRYTVKRNNSMISKVDEPFNPFLEVDTSLRQIDMNIVKSKTDINITEYIDVTARVKEDMVLMIYIDVKDIIRYSEGGVTIFDRYEHDTKRRFCM